MHANDQNHRAILQSIAHRVMLEGGFLPDFSAAALAELGRLQDWLAEGPPGIPDMRSLLWASIDNDDFARSGSAHGGRGHVGRQNEDPGCDS